MYLFSKDKYFLAGDGLANHAADSPPPSPSNENATSGRHSKASFWFLLEALEVSFFVSFVTFAVTIKRRYIPSFFTTITAKQFRVQLYREALTDSSKINILWYHPSYYENIRTEVKEWVQERWPVWINEEPDWFTDAVRESVPVDMIPENASDVKKLQELVARRRKSSAQLIAEAIEGVVNMQREQQFKGLIRR